MIATTTPLRQSLEELVRMRDASGVLSIYLDAGAERARRHRPRSGEIALRRELEELRGRLEREGPRERARALEARLGELGAALDELVDPARPGRGRALFVPLSGAPPHALALECPVGDRVELAPTAHAAPLLRALARSAPAGLAHVTREGLTVVELVDGRAEELLHEAYGIPSEDWRPMVGPAATNPAHPGTSESQRDLFARRLEEHRARRIAEIAPGLWDAARRRGWARIAVAGDAWALRALAMSRPDGAPELVPLDRRPGWAVTPELCDAAAQELARARIVADRALAERVRDAGLAPSGRAVLGLDDVLTALSEGRVARLLVDVDRRPAGAVAPDGRLVAEGEVPGGAAPEELTPEPHLLERLVERSLDTGAELVALEGRSAEPLASFGGLAAELRW